MEVWVGPALGAGAVVLGTLIAGWFQFRAARLQTEQSHANQLEAVEQAHRQQLEVMSAQVNREEELRIRQFAEADYADRMVVVEYVDLLMPRLFDTASIDYIASDNKDVDELKKFLQLQRYMFSDRRPDPAHPEATLDLRMAFLLFQLTAALRFALNARWTRPLSDEHRSFLLHWEDHIEPIICSGRYPGKELLYREQLEVIAGEMLTRPSSTEITRPLNWKEFCEKYEADAVIRDLAHTVADNIRFVFDEEKAVPPRKATQCRLAIMALYLIQIERDAGMNLWDRYVAPLWDVVQAFYRWESEQGQNPRWFVFELGDCKVA